MSNAPFVVAAKEVVDSLRDVRAVISSLLYSAMGPVVVGLVSLSSVARRDPAAAPTVLVGMMSVFTLVAAFTGGMNIAMDTIAGERERRSFLPLLMNPVHRLDIVLGKWMAVCLFAMIGLAVNLVCFAFVLAHSGIHPAVSSPRLPLTLALSLLPLPILAASIQLLISVVCRSVKEAQTYLSSVVFLPMGLGMFLVFFPGAQSWSGWFPLAGQQEYLEIILKGGDVALSQTIVLGFLTTAVALLALWYAAERLNGDEMSYGN